MKLDQNVIQKINNYLRDKPIKKAYIFGSHSRSEASQKSDVDILVELDYSKPIGLLFIKMQLELQDLLNRNVDLISEKAVSKYFRPFIDNDKELIYEK